MIAGHVRHHAHSFARPARAAGPAAGAAARLAAVARLWGFAVRPGLLLAALAQGALAALIGARLGLSVWWLPINLLFVPGLLLFRDLDVPAWAPLSGFALLLLLNWNAFGERVPLYLTGSQTERRLRARLAVLPTDFRLIDLGSGLAGTLVAGAGISGGALRRGGNRAADLRPVWLRCLPRRNCRSTRSACGASTSANTMSSTVSCHRHPWRRCGKRRGRKCAPVRC